jgi:hypothetical protein
MDNSRKRHLENQEEPPVDKRAKEEEKTPFQLLPEHRQHLEEHGWVVMPDVVPAEECKEMRDGLLDYLNTGPAKKGLKWHGNPKEWKTVNMPSGTIHHINRTAAHLPCQWQARQHPRVAQVWADFYKCDKMDLCVSFDGWNAAVGKSPKSREGIWAHTDQGPHPEKYPFVCVQGQLNLFDALDARLDGGLVVWDRSHTYHQSYFDSHPAIKAKVTGNWHKFDQAYLDEIEKKGMKRINVTAPVGAVVLWYSTTTHQNRAPLLGGQPRCVFYICMAPKSFLKPAAAALTKAGKPKKRQPLSEQEKRKACWEARGMSAHWPSGGHFHKFNEKPHLRSAAETAVWSTYWENNPLHRQVIPFTELGRSLMGFALP